MLPIEPSELRGRVLVVDDEDGVRSFLVEALERAGHEAVAAADGQEALRAARDEPFDVVLTDLRMPKVDGMTLVRTLRTEQPDVEVVVLTAFGDVATAVEAMKLGALDYLEKPLPSPTAVREIVARALDRRAAIVRDAEHSNAESASGPSAAGGAHPSLTFGAPAMKPVVEAVGKVAKTPATVLLLGESGTGKEVIARAIHATSPRAARPFVAINCAVLTEALLESELFGHEKGAFTGAIAQRRGRIELADGGTFFLDEVAELQPGLQAKLLRVLEERTFERLGGSRTLSVDVRWIAATHRDLRTMVRDGSFREDLYHRLAVFPIRIPPLRERRDDIAPLAEMLVARIAGAAGQSPPRIDDAARQQLASEPWSGNVRELRNVLERAMILAEGATIRLEHLLIDPAQAPESSPRLSGSLTDIERAAIERALAASDGNRRAAAARLGIGLRTLYEKLKRYGLR